MNKIDLHGCVAVITGRARGIGYAIAERMMISGAIVMLWDIDSAQLQKAEQQLSVSGKVSVYALELIRTCWPTSLRLPPLKQKF